MHIPDPNLRLLFASRPSSTDVDHNLAARYAPVLKFDAREPFLPHAVAYHIFRKSAPSPSFPRQIDLNTAEKPSPELAIEYAIWWDWDIVHLYELEHIWVFLDKSGQIVRAEASWHNDYRDMNADSDLPLTDERLTLYSEPGKHAFAPKVGWLMDRIDRTRHLCRQEAGARGLLITPLFDELASLKTPQVDRLVFAFLQRHAFEPSYNFTRAFAISADILVPWLALKNWIPTRLAWVIDNLK